MSRISKYERPPLESRSLSKDDIERGIKKFQRRIKEVEQLKNENVGYDDAKVNIAKSNIKETIRGIFGENSPEYRENEYIQIWHGNINTMDGDYERQEKFLNGIPQTVTILNGLISRLNEKLEDLPISHNIKIKDDISTGNKIFIVHGHDPNTKNTVARFIEKLGLKAIILHEQPDKSRTIIEKFEDHSSEVLFAVVLLTPDDIGYAKDNETEAKPRARQNVIFELGFFCGALSRKRVCILYTEGIELPSDYSGVIYIPLDSSDTWHFKLAKEIKAAGLDVDLNKI